MTVEWGPFQIRFNACSAPVSSGNIIKNVISVSFDVCIRYDLSVYMHTIHRQLCNNSSSTKFFSRRSTAHGEFKQ
jgi:hypothetical protein